MCRCKVYSYLHLYPFIKVLSTILPLITSYKKSNFLFLMNYLNQKNMDKYVEYWQEIGNLPDVELVGTNDFDCLPLLIMSYYNDYQFFLVN